MACSVPQRAVWLGEDPHGPQQRLQTMRASTCSLRVLQAGSGTQDGSIEGSLDTPVCTVGLDGRSGFHFSCNIYLAKFWLAIMAANILTSHSRCNITSAHGGAGGYLSK
eukprot:7123567-Pyramimonas_sp.AAC.1